MKVIEKIEIKSFRSFGNRKQNKTQITKIKDLNIFSGANDSGKSNILRALNLFFNKRTNLEDFLDFNNDFFKREKPDNDDVEQEQITIRLSFWNKKNKGINAKKKSYTRLPEKFWVSRKWLKSSEFSAFKQNSGIEVAFKEEKKENWQDFYEKNYKDLLSNVRANLSKQLTDFLDSIQYHYVPAIKDKNYFSHLYGELQQTLLKESNSSVNKNKKSFQNSIQDTTKDLMNDFKKVVNNEKINISAVFELPDLINLFKTLNVQTGQVNLKYRGDGIQAKLIPEILNFIAIKELEIKSSALNKGEKSKKYFIWGFEEPENSYEYVNAQLLAKRFKTVFSKNAQVFITTHSFNFISMNGDEISTYRVWKDPNIESSRVTKIKKESNGQFIFEGADFDNSEDRLNEELGVFTLNKDLDKLFTKNEEKKKELLRKITEIKKPILYTEGNNKIYLNRAKQIFADDLDIDIENIGGSDNLKKMFIQYSETTFNRFKLFFVFDCDAVKEFKYCHKIKNEYLIPFIFRKNNNNEIIKDGIENLFSKERFMDGKELNIRFFPKITIDKGDKKNINTQQKKLKDGKNGTKQDFCKFMCEERNENSDFKNFNTLFDFIKKELE